MFIVGGMSSLSISEACYFLERDFHIPAELVKVLAPLTVSTLNTRPDSFVVFCKAYFRKEANRLREQLNEEATRLRAEERSRELAMRGQRMGVSGDSFDPRNEPFTLCERDVFTKSPEEMVKISEIIDGLVVFEHVSSEIRSIVMSMFRPVKAAAGDVLIRKGQIVDNFFIVSRGEVVCGDESVMYFGELCLFYSYESELTVVAKTDVDLWILNGTEFHRLLVRCVFNENQKRKELLLKVDAFQNLDPIELERICDLLRKEKFSDGEIISAQEDDADCMYFVIEGIVELISREGSIRRKMRTCEAGDHFFEFTLICRKPRVSTALARAETHVFALHIDELEGIIGKCTNVIERNKETAANTYFKMTQETVLSRKFQ